MFRGLLEVAQEVVLPSFDRFAVNYVRAVTGLRLSKLVGGVAGVGSYTISIAPLAFQVVRIVAEKYVQLQLLGELAPDGLVELSIVDSVKKRPEKSLAVVEKPEIHKNPLHVAEVTQSTVKTASQRDLTLIATTHSDITLFVIAKLASKKVVTPQDVRVCYFERNPWTKASQIRLYADGTFDRLPGTEKMAAQLF